MRSNTALLIVHTPYTAPTSRKVVGARHVKCDPVISLPVSPRSVTFLELKSYTSDACQRRAPHVSMISYPSIEDGDRLKHIRNTAGTKLGKGQD